MTWTVEPPAMDGALAALDGIKQGVQDFAVIPMEAIMVAGRDDRETEYAIVVALMARSYEMRGRSFYPVATRRYADWPELLEVEHL
tara:strand:- start:3594 stop:3851 length:258 start_codon:yes stop_codon:yes gene_type:complete